MKIIELKNLVYSYPDDKDRIVLNNISYSINKGDVVQVTGRNGSGKTTLLKLLCSQLDHQQGELLVDNDPVFRYLDQNIVDMLAQPLTIYEQLMVIKTKQKGLMDDVIKYLSIYEIGLEGRLDSFVSDLSGGQKQILGLLVTLLGKVDIVLLDEFTSSMDPKSKNISHKILKDFKNKKNLTIIYVTHDSLGWKDQKLLKLE